MAKVTVKKTYFGKNGKPVEAGTTVDTNKKPEDMNPRIFDVPKKAKPEPAATGKGGKE